MAVRNDPRELGDEPQSLPSIQGLSYIGVLVDKSVFATLARSYELC